MNRNLAAAIRARLKQPADATKQDLFIGSRFTIHASFLRSVSLTQLRFTLLTVTSSQRDLHPTVSAHAGRTSA